MVCQSFSFHVLQLDAESEVNNEMANRMSLFYAEATPMLKTLSNATTKFVSEVSELQRRWEKSKARRNGVKERSRDNIPSSAGGTPLKSTEVQ